MINIREAKPSDIQIITDFQIKMARESEGISLNHATVSRGVEAVFSDSALGQYFVAEINQQVVASLLITPEWSDWRNAKVLWIQSVYVVRDFRRKGIFKKMYHYLKEMVDSSAEYAGLRLYVDKTNTSAREVYRQIGMNGDHYELFEWMKPMD